MGRIQRRMGMRCALREPRAQRAQGRRRQNRTELAKEGWAGTLDRQWPTVRLFASPGFASSVALRPLLRFIQHLAHHNKHLVYALQPWAFVWIKLPISPSSTCCYAKLSVFWASLPTAVLLSCCGSLFRHLRCCMFLGIPNLKVRGNSVHACS